MLLLKKIQQYALLMRMDKPIGFLLLLWPTLWALWLAADGHPKWQYILIFIAGAFIMRSAGCIINDLVDRRYDKHVKRTKERPLVTGRVSSKEAMVLVSLLLLIAFGLVLLCHLLTLQLAVIGLFLVGIYPFLKRITHLPQLGLGLAFSWGVPMAFAAQTGQVTANAWLLFFTAALWPIIYDTMYAMVDRDDDRRIGVKSTAILFRQYDILLIGLLQLLFLFMLFWVGHAFHLGRIYICSVLVSAVFFIYQQILIKNRDRQKCFQAFLNNHWVGLSIFFGIYTQTMAGIM